MYIKIDTVQIKKTLFYSGYAVGTDLPGTPPVSGNVSVGIGSLRLPIPTEKLYVLAKNKPLQTSQLAKKR